MSRTILTKVGGFTPLMDAVVQEVGMDAAAVFGVIWRYCQMEDGICRASAVTIGKRLGKERRFVFKYQKILEEHGFIKDVSFQYLDAKFLVTDEFGNDRVEGSVKVYADTGKAEMVGAIFTTDNYDFPEKDEGNFQIINKPNGEYQKGTGSSTKKVLGGSTKNVLGSSTNKVLGGGTENVLGQDQDGTGGSAQNVREEYPTGTGSSTSKVLKDSSLRKKKETSKEINPLFDSDSELTQANIFLKAAFTDIRNDNLIPAAEMSTWIYCLRAVFYDPHKPEITIGAFNEAGLNVLHTRNYGNIIQEALRKTWNPELTAKFVIKTN